MTKYETPEQLMDAMNGMNMAVLRDFARDSGVIPRNRRRAELIELILAAHKGQRQPESPKKSGRPTRSSTFGVSAPAPELVDDTINESSENVDQSWPRYGILEIMQDGYGFVRTSNYSSTPHKDYFLSANVITRMNLHAGDKLKVLLRQYPDKPAPTALFIQEINDQVCNSIRRTPFDALEACFPNERIRLDGDKHDYSLRALDLVAPIGKGQRGLIVAPPKTSKMVLPVLGGATISPR